MPIEQLATLRQSLPRLGRLVRRMRPTYELPSVTAITASFLHAEGIRAVLWDVDGTIMAYHAPEVDPAFSHLHGLFAHGPAHHAILSNCDERRFDQLAQLFPEVPLIRGYETHETMVFRHRTGDADTHGPESVRALLTDGHQLRKPSGELVRYGMRVLEVDDPAAVLMVGDQYLTDIASANLAGVRSAKVPTFGRATFPVHLRGSQVLERLLYQALGRHLAARR